MGRKKKGNKGPDPGEASKEVKPQDSTAPSQGQGARPEQGQQQGQGQEVSTPPQVQAWGPPQRHGNDRGAPPQGQGRGAPPQGQGQAWGAPQQMHGRGALPQVQAQAWGAPPQEQGRGAPPQGHGRGAPPQEQGRGAPPQGQGRGAPPQVQGQAWGAPQQMQGRGAPPQVQAQAWGAPPQEQGRGAPPQEQGRGAPPQVQGQAWGTQQQIQGRGAPPQGPGQPWVGPQQGQRSPQGAQQGQGRGAPPQEQGQPRGGPQQGKGRGSPAHQGQTQPCGGAQQGQGSRAPPQGQGQVISGPPQGQQEQRQPQQQVTRPKQPSGGQGDIQAITSKMASSKVSAGGDGILIKDQISKAGTKGRRIPIFTNHFELSLGRVKKVIHYDVDIQPDTPKRMLKDAFQLFKKAYFNKFNPAFDGRKNAYSARELPFGQEQCGTVVVEEAGMKPREYKIKMQKVNIVDLETITQFLKQAQGNRILDEPMAALQAIDIVLRHSLAMQCINVGRSFFTPPGRTQIINLGNGMEMYRGFFQSVSLGWKPFLNVDVANKAFPKRQDTISLLNELCPRSNLKEGLQRWDAETFTKFIKGLRIEYQLPNKPSSIKRYRVNGTNGSAASITFDYKNDKGASRKVTIQEYYKLAYGIQLQYPHLPCLWVGALSKEQKTYLPCEFCVVLEGQAVNRKLDANQTREMIKQCATHTDIRKNSIKTSLQRANYNNDPTVNEFDLKISDEFLKLDARILTPPNLEYANRSVAQVKRGVWNAAIFLKSVEMQKWTILNLDGRTRPDALDKLASFLNNGTRQVGMRMGPPVKPFQEIKTFRNNRLMQDLSTFFEKNKDMQIIFVVIPEEDKIYNYVKQAAELAVGCLTQCLKASTVFKKLNAATIGNILLKVNAKLNGTNHALKERPPIMNEPTMIMGADVTHPSPDARDIPSVAAVTASHDPKAFGYNICWRLQPPKVEIIEDLENITLEQMRFFCQRTNVWPKRIIFYRDGVSNGQFQEVLQSELQAIRRACSKVNVNCKPAITFIVVQKRHHTRFFPANPRDSEDRNCNVPAGTCVDTDIVHPTRQNFFLVSHASIQGVAKPTKYVTLWDDNDFSNDDLESLTYHLCHMFARCTRSVSYPAPTYYAHLAAARAKVYIETSQLNMNNLSGEQSRLQIKEQIVKGLPMFFV